MTVGESVTIATISASSTIHPEYLYLVPHYLQTLRHHRLKQSI